MTVAAKREEGRDALRIAIDVPEELRETFAFLPGQRVRRG